MYPRAAILRRKMNEPPYYVYCIAGSIFNFLLTSIITYNIITLIVLYGQTMLEKVLRQQHCSYLTELFNHCPQSPGLG